MAEPRTVRENANALNSEQIAALLPHRYPFALVDRILDYEPGQWAIGRKCVTRNEEFFCGHFPGQPVIDHTNNEAIYARNKIRLELLPMLREKFNPNIIETINRLGKNAAADKDYLAQQARDAYEEALEDADGRSCTVEVTTAKLDRMHKAVRMRVYNYLLADVGMEENLTEGQLEAIEKVRISQSPSAMCDLADGFRVYKIYDRIRFCREADTEEGRQLRMRFMSAEEYAKEKKTAHAPDADGGETAARVVGIFALPPGAEDSVCIRKRRDGDVIAIASKSRPQGAAQTPDTAPPQVRHKKLQDFLVDAKVPKSVRDDIDLLAYGNRILWVLPSPHFASRQYREKGRFSAEFKPGVMPGAGTGSTAAAAPGDGANNMPDNVPETILILEIL